MTPSIYEYSSYKEYLQTWIASRPNRGRGIKGQFAKVLNVSTTLVSFIISGKQPPTPEQACILAEFMGLGESDTDFFFLLVELDRAGHFRLKQRLERKIRSAREQSRKVSKRIKKDAELSDELKAIYYSSWVFTGIRNLVATGEFKDPTAIARRLNLPATTITRALHFLLEHKLCIQGENGITAGPVYTHVDADSPYVNKHRQNWRLRGFTVMEQNSDQDLFYTSPMSLSRADAEKVRAHLLKSIDEIVGIMRPSPSECVRCLNIDWFDY